VPDLQHLKKFVEEVGTTEMRQPTMITGDLKAHSAFT
jgi:hypothetical protein